MTTGGASVDSTHIYQNSDGSFTYSYFTTISGSYTTTVIINGQQVGGTAYTTVVSPSRYFLSVVVLSFAHSLCAVSARAAQQ